LAPIGGVGLGRRLLIGAVLASAGLAAAAYAVLRVHPPGARLARLQAYRADPAAHAPWAMRAGERCGAAPFLFPTDGLIGFVWGDSFQLGHRHQGVDIFGPGELGQTPVLAAADGYLSRLPAWHSAVIVRVPHDPLQPGRQIWIYYTHMADAQGRSFIDAAFPPGTTERRVLAGTRLGYQGNYSADPLNPVGIHLHISIVLDDGAGRFRNELEIANTLDPSPYFGLELNADRLGDALAVCPPEATPAGGAP
jgi:murein DD-endopeptidase MepM/ murein hydrolase activator NlpD